MFFRDKCLGQCFLLLILAGSFFSVHACGPSSSSSEKTREVTADGGGKPDRKIGDCDAFWCRNKPLPDRPRTDWKRKSQNITISFEQPNPGVRIDLLRVTGKVEVAEDKIALIEIAIRDLATEKYWDGKSFSKEERKNFKLKGKSKFEFDSSRIPFRWNMSYDLIVRATDQKRKYKDKSYVWRSGSAWTLRSGGGNLRLGSNATGKFPYVLDGEGRFYRGVEAGQAWLPQSVGPIYAFSFSKQKRNVVLVGDKGAIWYSKDGGMVWEKAKSKSKTSLLSLAEAEDGSFFLAGSLSGSLVKSSDQGKSWKTIKTKLSGRIERLLSLSKSKWLMVLKKKDESFIYSSLDEGKTWKKLSLPNDFSGVSDIWSSKSLSVVIAVGSDGGIFQSLDKAKTWNEIEIQDVTGLRLHSVSGHRDGKRIFVVGSKGVVLFSSTKGSSWKVLRASDESQEDLFGVYEALDQSYLLLSGGGGSLLRSSDSGKSWKQQWKRTLATHRTIHALDFPQGILVGYLAGEGGIFKTTNTGVSWVKVSKERNFFGLWFHTEDLGVAVGEKICLTSDAGKSWSCQDSPDKKSLRAVLFISFKDGFAVGEEGLLIQTIDGGKSWKKLPAKVSGTLKAIDFLDKSFGLVVGDAGSVLRTDDGGKTWKKVKIAKKVDWAGISHLSTGEFFIVGSGGAVLMSKDKGKTWTALKVPTTEDLLAIEFSGTLSTGYITGKAGTILSTWDNGESWELLKTVFRTDLETLSFPSGSHVGYMAGSGGSLVFTRFDGK